MDNASEFKFTSHEGQFSYTILPIDRRKEALDILEKGFYPHENVCKSINLTGNPKAVAELNELATEAIKDGVSIMAVDNTTNEIIGLSINKIQKLPAPGEVSFLEKFMKKCKEKETLMIMQFLIDCDSRVDLFKHFDTNQLGEIMYLAVLPEYRQKKIASELIKVDLELLNLFYKNFKGPSAAAAAATSDFTAKIGQRVGFQLLSECFYDQIEYEGVKLSDKIDSQHKSTKVVGKKLEN